MQNDSYNRGGFIAFLFSMFFSLAFFVYVTAIHPGVDLKEVPQTDPAAQALAESGTGAAKQIDIRSIAKPWEENADVATHGGQVYGNTCAVCHGPGGMGDGPAGKALQPPPRNLVEGKWKVGGDSVSLFKTISSGIQGTSMAGFGHLTVADRWSLVQYVRSITKNRVKDDPAKTSAFAETAQ